MSSYNSPDEPGAETPRRPDRYLTYRDARDDPPMQQRFILRRVAGLVLAMALVASCGFIWVMCNLHLGPPPPPPLDWKEPLMLNLLILAPMGAGTFWAHRRGNRAFVIGVLIGIASAGLMEEVCFYHP